MTSLEQTLGRLHEQVSRAWNEARQIALPASYKSIDRVVVVAMGGSALGVHLIKSALADRITVPIEIVNDYTLPAFAGPTTLVILSSFSGTTEEVLSAYKAARARKLKIFVLTNGGSLAEAAKKDRVPAYVFDPADLAPQPRYGTGFMAMGPLAVLKSLGVVRISDKEIFDVSEHLKKGIATWRKEARAVAKKLVHRTNVLVASEHLEGAAHIFANQMNESAKHFAARFSIPEMNHHLMEGLTFPKEAVRQMTVLFLESDLYHPRVQKRYGLTQTVVKKNGAKALALRASGRMPLAQAFELVQRGAFITAAMAELSGVDPEQIPWVNWFKRQM